MRLLGAVSIDLAAFTEGLVRCKGFLKRTGLYVSRCVVSNLLTNVAPTYPLA